MATPTQILIQVTDILENLSIPYFVVGSFASSARGIRRATVDADIVAAITPAHVKDIVDRLAAQDFYVDDQAIYRAIEQERAFNAIHRESMFKIDVYIARDSFSQTEMARRVPERILPNSESLVYIATAEDTVLAKLSWYRKGGEVSDQQWRDVQGILKMQKHNLDSAYLDHWSNRLGVRDLLDKAMAEA